MEKSVAEKPTEDIKQEVMQDTVINEDKKSLEPSDCCIPNCCDKVEVMDIEDTIRTTLEDMAREIDSYPYVLSEETVSNINSIFKEAKNYQKENCALKQQLKKNEAAEKVVSKLKPQLQERDSKIKELETEISIQIEETKKTSEQKDIKELAQLL